MTLKKVVSISHDDVFETSGEKDGNLSNKCSVKLGDTAIEGKKVALCPAGYFCPEGTLADPNDTSFTKDILVASKENTLAEVKEQKQLSQLPQVAEFGVVNYSFQPLLADQEEKQERTQLECPRGWYCLKGTYGRRWDLSCQKDPFKCAISEGVQYDVQTEGSNAIEHPEICPPGYFCPRNTKLDPRTLRDAKSEEHKKYLCPKGYYCPKGTQSDPKDNSVAYKCDINTKNSKNTDITDPNHEYDETKCVNKSERLHRAVKCPPGYYCPEGTAVDPRLKNNSPFWNAKLDPNSTDQSYNLNQQSLISKTMDIVLSTGTSASVVSETYDSLKCQNGYFCPPGSVDEYGRQANENKEENKRKCPAGYYCPMGTAGNDNLLKGALRDTQIDLHTHGNAYICPKGYFCEEATLASDSSCDNTRLLW